MDYNWRAEGAHEAGREGYQNSSLANFWEVQVGTMKKSLGDGWCSVCFSLMRRECLFNTLVVFSKNQANFYTHFSTIFCKE